MSTAPKVGGIPNMVVYGFIAGAVIILLLCGGVGLFYIVTQGGFGGPAVNQSGKAISAEDALKATDLFVKELGREEYAHAIKYRTTSAFQRRYNEESLKELVESKGRGLIGATNWHFKEIGRTPGTIKFVGQVGGGPSGAARFELTLADEGQGVRVSELEFKAN